MIFYVELKLVFLFFLSYIISDLSRASNQALILGIYDDSKPYFSSIREESNTGMAQDVLNSIFETMGYDVSYLRMPYLRAIAQVKKGIIDGVLILRIDGRLTGDIPSDSCSRRPLASVKIGLYDKVAHHERSIEPRKNNLRIGIFRSIEDIILPFREKYSEADLVTFRTMKLALLSLKANRINAVIMDEGNAYYWGEILDQETVLENSLGIAEPVLCFSQNWLSKKEAFVERYDNAQSIAYKEGHLESIFDHQDLLPYKPIFVNRKIYPESFNTLQK